MTTIEAFAPGRVNLIGDHTDHQGGLVLPLALQLGTTVRAHVGGDRVRLRSPDEPGLVDIPLTGVGGAVVPPWGRTVAALVGLIAPDQGIDGAVTTTLPIGRGLASSAALELAVALALGVDAPAAALAALGQEAEQVATGVPCGIMDQLVSAAGIEGHALLIDCHTLRVEPVALPPDLVVLVVDSGERRSLAATAYAERVAACARAEAEVGPLRLGPDTDAIADPVIRRRARHVVSEDARVRAFVAAIRAGDGAGAGRLMVASHDSLRRDFEVSTATLDALVAALVAQPGILGARLTGAGFGGCVVALAEAGAPRPRGAFVAQPSAGARRVRHDGGD